MVKLILFGLALGILLCEAYEFTHVIQTNRLPQKTSTITIGGIFPMSGQWAGGIGSYPAVLKALEDVNMNASVLPNHYLVLQANDSKVSLICFHYYGN